MHARMHVACIGRTQLDTLKSRGFEECARKEGVILHSVSKVAPDVLSPHPRPDANLVFMRSESINEGRSEFN